MTDVNQIWGLLPVGRLEVYKDGFCIILVYRGYFRFLNLFDQVQVVAISAIGRVDGHEVVQGLKGIVGSTYSH